MNDLPLGSLATPKQTSVSDLVISVTETFSAGLTFEGGFLPPEIPPSDLPAPFDDYLRAGAELAPRYHGNQRGVRSWLDALFRESPAHLEANLDQLNEPQRDRLFAVISVLAHAYRWDTAPPRKEEYFRDRIVLPAGLSSPWGSLARRLEVPRVGNLYSMVLCNLRLKSKPQGGLFKNSEIVGSNIEISHPWLLTPDDEALRSFLLAPIETEARGALAIRTLIELLRAVVANDPHQVTYLLDRLRSEIQQMGLPFREFIQKKTIKPDQFLNLIQPTTIWGLDEGDGHGPLEGASGPQVGCIQAIDALLGVQRLSPMGKAILRSRDYMPMRHRRFLQAVDAATRVLPDFVQAQQQSQMTALFNECLEGMEAWRRVHQVRGAIFLKGETPAADRKYMSTGGVVGLEEERIEKFKASMEERSSETLAALFPEVPLAPGAGLAVSFQYLTPEDRELLVSAAIRKTFSPQAVIVAEGVRRAGLYLVQAGTVRVARRCNSRDIVLARLGAGGLFGEMSFLENESTSASILAEGDCTLDIIPREHVFALFRDREGFAARFFHSLATLLSNRLAGASDLAAELLSEESRAAFRGRPLRTSSAPVPGKAITLARRFRCEVDQAGANVADLNCALDGILCFMQSGPAELREDWPAAADHLFKETFHVWMRSALGQSLYQRPGGHPCDSTTMEMLLGPSQGDDTSGIIVDAWMRRLPTLGSLSQHQRILSSLLASEFGGSGNVPLRILSLGAAPAAFLCETLTRHENASATALEWNSKDAAATRRGASVHGLELRMTIVHDHLVRRARQRSRHIADQYQIIVADQLLHFLGDDDVIAIFDWAQRQLVPGGVFIGATLLPEAVDRVFLECLLDWAPERRPEDEIRRLVAESGFRKAAVTVRKEAGVLLSFSIRKAA